jgi:hypothetical protein
MVAFSMLLELLKEKHPNNTMNHCRKVTKFTKVTEMV